MVVAHQLAHQPVAEILEVVQPLAQVRVGRAQHARAGVRLHALDGGLRGDAGRHRIRQPPRPAVVVGEHAIGFEHVAMLAAFGDVAALEHAVEVGAQLRQRRVEALQFLRHVLGDVVGDDDARLVQHDMAERDAVGEDRAFEMDRMPRGGFGAGFCERRELARGDHLRQHHGGGLQRLDFLFDIGAVRAVLHHQHAERVARAENRHAEERVIDFFAGLRPVRERRMALRVGQVQRVGFAGDEADEAFVGLQHRLVHGLAVQTFGGVEFQRAVMAQHVGGAHLGDHVGGDQHDDLVEPLLRRDLLRHDFAETSQQDAWSSRSAPHVLAPDLQTCNAADSAQAGTGRQH